MVRRRHPPNGTGFPADKRIRPARCRLAAHAGELWRADSRRFSPGRAIDASLVDDVEDLLIEADVGVDMTDLIVADLRARLKRRSLPDGEAVYAVLRDNMGRALQPVARPIDIPERLRRPYVILVVGVNGVGKTTTIGKLARRFLGEGAFRHAGRRRHVSRRRNRTARSMGRTKRGPGDCPGSRVRTPPPWYSSALEAATARSADILIADTAGRLHTRTGLMEELAKVRRVLGKIDPAAPHETLLVLDATTGQNGLAQARRFTEAVQVSGVAVTKLDGTARGGMLFAIARELALPIRFVGVGEGIDDLWDFDPTAFVDAIVAR